MLVSSFVAQNGLNQVEVVEVLDFSEDLDASLLCVLENDLEAVLDGGAEVEVLLVDFELVVIHLGQVQEVVDEVFHH